MSKIGLGKITQELIPKSGNPRNSEGAFIRLDDGGILYAYSRYCGTSGGDEADCDIAALFSYDNGESWTSPQIIIKASQFKVKNVMSVSLLRMNNGDIGLFYCVKLLEGGSNYALSRSNDNGKSFYQTTTCLDDVVKGYYVMNNDRVERLSNGRIVLPVCFHRMSLDGINNKITAMDAYGTVLFIVSDDDGETFREAEGRMVMGNTAHSIMGLQEPGLIELKNGALWGYARTDRGFQYESLSIDNLRSLTPAQPSRFTAPCSPMKIKRFASTGELFAVWNPIPRYNGRPLEGIRSDRTPIVIAKSGDDGQTWSEPQTLDDDPRRGYCYPALFFTGEGHLLLSYCCGGPEDGWELNRTCIRKIALVDIQ